MKRDDWSRVDALLDAALKRPPEERPSFIERACASDAELAAEVRRLLALSEEEDARLDAPDLGGLLEAAGSEAEERLPIGYRIGAYEITGFLGSGGMGTVYRAHDHDLERDVAVKALSRRVALDPSFSRRFQREAKLLASLNHPNIGGIYGIVTDEHAHLYLILELIEGESLNERIARGVLRLEEVLSLATQLVDGIEAAHAKAVVHRDLKPGNVIVTAAGRVKILDFGLAKSRADAPSADGTLSTQSGVVLGTPSYMSPEHARGEAVHEGADIWAFGCLLYELLTGEPLFRGDSPSETLASVLRDEVDWSRLPESTPPALKRLLRRCLQKPVRDRLQHIGDARIELEELASGAWDVSKPGKRAGALILATLGVLAVAAGGYRWLTRGDPVLRFENPVQITSSEARDDFPAWSPDGKTLAFASLGVDGWNVWVQPRDGRLKNRTPGYDGVNWAPSWLADGREIVFRSDRDGGGLYAAPLNGGLARFVSAVPDATNISSSAQASPDGTELAYIVFHSKRASAQVLEILTLATGETRQIELPHQRNCLCQLAWSPGGRFLVYADAQDPNAASDAALALPLRGRRGAHDHERRRTPLEPELFRRCALAFLRLRSRREHGSLAAALASRRNTQWGASCDYDRRGYAARRCLA